MPTAKFVNFLEACAPLNAAQKLAATGQPQTELCDWKAAT
jgi:hypothetical protein